VNALARLSVVVALAAIPSASIAGAASQASATLLRLEAKIPLGKVRGRIDHLAIDLARQRLFVAELGNDSLAVVDLREGGTVRTLGGLHEPQGIGYVPSTDTVYVANAGDGSVRLFRATDLAPAGEIALGDDADNVRVDDAAHRIFVGYGAGALAVLDTASVRKLALINLPAHPESFQLGSTRIFVNVPDAREIAVIDRATLRQTTRWSMGALRANFSMALDESQHTVLVVFRRPARLGVFRPRDGQLLASHDTCADADDLFFDARRHRVYVICGEGMIDILDVQGQAVRELARVPTARGARTGLFAAQLDRLFVAVRATAGEPAAIWTYQPTP